MDRDASSGVAIRGDMFPRRPTGDATVLHDRAVNANVLSRADPRMSTSPFSPLRRAAAISASLYRIAADGVAVPARDGCCQRLGTLFCKLRVVLHEGVRRHFPASGSVSVDDLRDDREGLLARGRSGYRAGIDQLAADETMRSALTSAPEVLIGEIDQDGFVRSEVGELRVCPTVSAKDFAPRTRFDLKLVAWHGILAVRKGYRGDSLAFVTEIRALDGLARAGCRVPALLDIDFDRLQIVISYIPGKVLREALAEEGAVLRDRDIGRSPLALLSPKQLRLARIQQGRRLLSAVVEEPFVEDLYRQLRRMHARRFVWHGIKYGNVVIERNSGKPHLIDFDNTSHHPNLDGRAFRLLSDSDVENFNLHFGTAKPTSEGLRRRANAIARARALRRRQRRRQRSNT